MKEPAHLTLHPFGQIPTYEEGDLALFETGSIVFHIAEPQDSLANLGIEGHWEVYSLRAGPLRGQTGQHLLVLSLTDSDSKPSPAEPKSCSAV